jgi:protein SCO1/2
LRQTLAHFLLGALLLVAVAVGGCGSSGSAQRDPAPTTTNKLEGLILAPAEPAPPLVEHNFNGPLVSLASMRGKAVFVTFVYTRCPNVCPLIVSNLATAQRLLGGAARNVRFVAVTVDPTRDTPGAVKAFLSVRGALGRMDYLIGDRVRLMPIWKAWHVEVAIDNKLVTTGHSALVYGITASGRIAVVYPSSFTPQQIVHDASLLERS